VRVAMNTLKTWKRGGEKEKMAKVDIPKKLGMIEAVLSILDEDVVTPDRLDAFAEAVALYKEWLRLKEQE